MPDKMIIVLCATKNMYEQLNRVLVMLERTQKLDYDVYCFTEGGVYCDKNNVHIFDVSNLEYAKNNIINGRTNWTWMTLVRCYITDYLDENISKVLYLDLDIDISGDLSELWNIDISNYALAGSVDVGIHLWIVPPYIKNPEKYINAGVLLMNLDWFRKNNTLRLLDNLLNSQRLYYCDQDALNLACKDNILLISNRYNSGEPCGFVDNALISHCAHLKPWKKESKFYQKYCEDIKTEILKVD